MSNLKFETLEILKENGKTIKDIRWVGSKDIAIPLDLFWILADTEYNNGFGSQKVARDLVVVGDNWWLERGEYDGSEWWEYKEKPKEPEFLIIPETLFPKRDTDYKKFYLCEFL